MHQLELRNIILLALCWAWTFSTATLLTFVGPKASETITNSTFDAALTLALIVIGTAFCNIPSPYVFDTYGRKIGFLLGGISTVLGSLVSIIALQQRVVELLFLGSLLVGVGVGFGQFYRFAAMEVASKQNQGWAVTGTLTGGCFAAFLGPTLGLYSRDMTNVQYVGSYVALCMLGVANISTLLLVKFNPSSSDVENCGSSEQGCSSSRPGVSGTHGGDLELSTIATGDVEGKGGAQASKNWRSRLIIILSAVRSRIFIQSTLISTVAQIFMIIVMVNSVVELELMDYNILVQSLVLDMHFLAMFATGPLTGYLLRMYGVNKVAFIGWGIMVMGLAVTLIEVALWSFFIGVVLVGVSWNILFSTGTVMLAKVYTNTAEDNSIQGIFEFFINAISGLTAALAGFILAQFGWYTLICILAVVFGGITLFLPCYYHAFYGSIVSHGTTSPGDDKLYDCAVDDCSRSSSDNSGAALDAGQDRCISNPLNQANR